MTENFNNQVDCPNVRVPWLLGQNHATARAVIFRPGCKLWSCPVCGPSNAWKWSFIADSGAHALHDAGRTLSFATITSSNKIGAKQSWWVARPAWMKLQARIRREYGEYQYFLVPEVQQRGHVHYHGIFGIALNRRWLKDNAAACGFGYMDDAKEVWSEGGVTGYVVKYLSKTLTVAEIPPRTRRVRTSRNWPRTETNPAPDWEFTKICPGVQLADIEHGLIARGYEVRFAGSKSAWKLVKEDADE